MKKILISAIFAVVAAFSFTGCYDAIFQSIRDEVELEEGTITGFVNNIARLGNGTKEYLITANGLLYVKDASVSAHGAWSELSGNGLPGKISYSYWDSEFSGIHFYKVAADKDNVYALGYSFVYDDDQTRNVPDKFVLYTAPIAFTASGNLNLVWTLASDVTAKLNAYKSSLSSDNFSMDLSIHLFCTNTYAQANRKAYIRVGGGSPYVANSANSTWAVYELAGASNVTASTNAEVTRYTLSAVYYGGAVHFMNYLNAITNEKTGHTAEYVYFGDSGSYLSSFKASDAVNGTYYKDAAGSESVSVTDIQAFCCGYYTKDNSTTPATYSVVQPSTLKRVDLGTGANIISMCATKDSLLLGTGYNRSEGSSSGTGKGIFKVALADGVPGTSTVSFSTNADSVMCSPYYVRLLFCTDPSKNEVEADLYSSMDYIYTESSSGTSISNRGLWAYYPGRGNWNRE